MLQLDIELDNIISKIIESKDVRIFAERKIQQMSDSRWVNIPAEIVKLTQLEKGEKVQFVFVPTVSEEIILIKVNKK